ncbi:adenylosuccinate lyase [Liquorilactobacillus sicerae]|uniref:adenylosuccinate lyase n=1 Tax=Liquorilactobacillus sicerae TaxID=1416943 RepID=UPI00247FB289|nr:adenylosuccinate lyase [Liquorilactobacillus sicerae]
MASSVIDSELFKDQYGTKSMRQVFSEKSQIQSWLNAWSALAQAEALEKIIPAEAAEEIKAKAQVDNIDMAEVRRGFKITAHPLMPQIQSFSRVLSPQAAKYLHWGATTQDITDTGLVLQIKAAQRIIEIQVHQILEDCLQRAKQYRNLVMAGRTHGQQAVPITLGYKVAIWAAEFGRHVERLQQGKRRYLVGELGGAAGTLASLGDKGLDVQKRYCQILGLNEPLISWHVSRDGFAEFASIQALIAGTVAKIANEIINLQRTEIGEVEEGFTMGKIGSSTMPQKRNPMICENIVALTRLVQANASLGFSGMVQEHERDMTFWQTDWSYLPQMCLNLSKALQMLHQVLTEMLVHEDRVKENLSMTHGMIVAERVMLVLGHYIGRQRAHQVIYENCMQAFKQRKPLLKFLLQDERVTKKVDEATLIQILNPENYSGQAQEMVDRVLKQYSALENKKHS